jgi:hypothetical protein
MLVTPTVVVLALLGQGDAPTAAARVKETAYARVSRAQSLARDGTIRDAVVASNGVAETAEEIRRRDASWIASRRYALRQTIVQAPCSGRLRELVKDDPLIVEAFAMNSRGTLVCSITETSDYWQGDEPKWQRTFVEGREAFVEEPAFDASSGTYAIQLSVPIADGPRRVGAMTLTLKLARRDATGKP